LVSSEHLRTSVASKAVLYIAYHISRTVSLGKYGSFQSNLVLGRPYNLTYELLDKQVGQSHGGLRIVPASEIHADTIAEEEAAVNASPGDITIGGDGVEFDLVGENGDLMMRSNRETVDDSARQTLTMEEIEALKRDSTDAGKDLIAKLMSSHTALDQKTAFSLAKYKLLKTKKYLRRFTILPLDVSLLTQWLIEDKDPGRIMELREELLALAGCWGNVHFSEDAHSGSDAGTSGGRWLVIDEVGGLLVAAMAERMGILNPQEDEEEPPENNTLEDHISKAQSNGQMQVSSRHPANDLGSGLASTNTITLIHSNAQPNLSLLKYFFFLPDAPPTVPVHPLHTHLKTLSWLQLLSPEDDSTYSTPPPNATPDQIASWKSGKRGTYYRKRRRYARVEAIVDETRAGGFDGLIVASYMDATGILKACVPLLRGGAQVAIYSPTVEPLAQLADLYSMSRRTAFITSPPAELRGSEDSTAEEKGKVDPSAWQGNEDFPLNPTLLLGVTVQTSKVRKWQVLPGRTHPLMTGRGGAEGYLFTAVRVIPAEGKVAARGKFSTKKRKVESVGEDIKDEGVPVVKNMGTTIENAETSGVEGEVGGNITSEAVAKETEQS
jgi:tRNA (adenine-N(1)-)-methyltransferase non-catalytic subunit